MDFCNHYHRVLLIKIMYKCTKKLLKESMCLSGGKQIHNSGGNARQDDDCQKSP